MIRIEQVSKTFDAGSANEVKALQGVTMHIHPGEFVVIIGANGSGKSTLLNCIAGSTVADSGSIYIGEHEIQSFPEHKRSRFIGRIFQNPLQGTAPSLSVLENFRLASLRADQHRLHIGNNQHFAALVQEKVSSLHMGLEDKLQQPMGVLSGGQRQALTLLMAVMSSCQLLLLDEPTAALDPRSADLVLRNADRIIREHKLSAMLITHHMKDAQQFGDRIVIMQEGRLAGEIKGAEKETLKAADLLNWF